MHHCFPFWFRFGTILERFTLNSAGLSVLLDLSDRFFSKSRVALLCLLRLVLRRIHSRVGHELPLPLRLVPFRLVLELVTSIPELFVLVKVVPEIVFVDEGAVGRVDQNTVWLHLR